jgi:arylformamidase
MIIHDITPPVSLNLAVWPGDVPLTHHSTLSQDRGDSVNVTEIRGTVHLGAHADGPRHFDSRGWDISRVPLDFYLGLARVIECLGVSEITPEHLAGVPWDATERLLIKTLSRFHATEFNEHFPHLSEPAGELIASRGLRLVGVDVPSVDARHSKTLANHRAFLRSRTAILENLDLSQIRPGVYELIALPLKLVDADSSPVRAVLVER